jgi:hypothetical protein
MRFASSFGPATTNAALDPFTIAEMVEAAVAHFAPQRVTPDTLHPLVRQICTEVALGQRAQTGESGKQARRRAALQADALKRLGLEQQMRCLYFASGCHGVNLGMYVTGAMVGLKLEAIRWMVAVGGEPARA